MIEERRWPMGNKTMELHGGYGPITTIKWKENLIAWANDKVELRFRELRFWENIDIRLPSVFLTPQMVLVYDTTLRERIASISFEEERCVEEVYLAVGGGGEGGGTV